MCKMLQVFFATLAVMMVISTCAFGGLEYLSVCKKERTAESEAEQKRQGSLYHIPKHVIYFEQRIFPLLLHKFSGPILVDLHSFDPILAEFVGQRLHGQSAELLVHAVRKRGLPLGSDTFQRCQPPGLLGGALQALSLIEGNISPPVRQQRHLCLSPMDCCYQPNASAC